MKKYLIFAFLLISVSSFGQVFSSQGWCEKGGQGTVTQGLQSQGTFTLGSNTLIPNSGVQASYPLCQVDVYLTGTTNHATIYSDIGSDPLGNPFTANADGSYLFFAAGTCYDIVTSAGMHSTMPSPQTLTDVCLGGGTPGTGTVTGFSAGALSPLFITSVATASTTPALSFTLSSVAGNTVYGNFGSGSGVPSFGSIVVGQLPFTYSGTGTLLATVSGSFSGTGASVCRDASGNLTTAGCTGAGVTSFNSRTGAVTPQTGDYLVSQVTGAAPLLSPALTGVPTAPTATVGTNTTQLATTAFVVANASVSSVFGRSGAVTAQNGDYTVTQVTGAAPLANPSLTGIPLAPTASLGTNTTQIATTAFVLANGSGGGGSALPANSVQVSAPSGVLVSGNVRYVNATNYVWTQTPSGTLTASTPATVTLSPCPLGVDGTDTWSYVHIGTQGTPEDTQITGGSCTGGAGSGTITITPANSHGAGYTIASSTQGWQEASNDARITPTNPTGSVQSGVVVGAPGEYTWTARMSVRATQQTLDFSGTIIDCNMADTCLFIGNPANSTTVQDAWVKNFRGRPLITNGTATMIEDNGFHTKLERVDTRNGLSGGTFGYDVQVDGDQAADISGVDPSLGSPNVRCDSTFCGSIIYAPGNFSSNPAVGWVHDSNLSVNCGGNGINWQSGNTLHVENVVIQGYAQFGITTGLAKGGFGGTVLDNVYEEAGSCGPNPLGNIGQAGVINEGGVLTIRGGEGPSGTFPIFKTQAGTQRNYFVVVHDSVLGPSVVLPIGIASPTSGTITVLWPQVTGTNTITYDVLAVDGSPGTLNPIVPVGTATQAVSGSVGISGSCSSGICTATDTYATPLASYAVPFPTYYPLIPFWPGNIFLTTAGDTQQSPSVGTVYMDQSIGNIVTEAILVPTVFAHRCENTTQQNGLWISCLAGDSAQNNSVSPATMMEFSDGNGLAGYTGRLGFASNRNFIYGPSHIITLLDSNPQATLATPLMRRPYNATDSYIAVDNGAAGLAPATATIGEGTPVSWSRYIASNPDGTSWKERLTASSIFWTVPFGSTAVLFAALPTCNSSTQGLIRAVSNSNTNTWGATVAGGGAFLINAFCNATNWTVEGGSGSGGGSGTVTSVTFTGDGTVLSSTPSSAVTTSGTVAATLANAGAGTLLGNSTGSSAAPTYTATPVLGVDNATAGTVQLANGSAAAHTIFASGATTTNTIKGFTAVPTNGHLVTCTVSGTICTLTDGGAVPSAGVSSFSGDGTIITNSASTGAVTATIAGTSGGIPYFSSTSGWASSALLAAGGVVLGGGAATAPTTNTHLTFSTNTLTVGLAGTGSGILALAGVTSGSATMTAPSTAGTATNPFVFSNGIQVPANGSNCTAPAYQFAGTANGFNEGSNAIEVCSNSLANAEFFGGTVTIPSGGVYWFNIGTRDIGIARAGSTLLEVAQGNAVNSNGGLSASYIQHGGTKYTLSSNACSATTTLGGATGGSFLSGTTGACAVTVTMGNTDTATTGWHCSAADHTTPANLYSETGVASTTTASFTGTTVSGDLITFGCEAY